MSEKEAKGKKGKVEGEAKAPKGPPPSKTEEKRAEIERVTHIGAD